MEIAENIISMKNRALKISLIITLSLAAAAIIGLFATVAAVTHSGDYVSFDTEKLNNVHNTLTILDENGDKITDPIYVNRFKQVPLDSLHDYTVQAFVSVEDKRFYKHKGLDVKRIAGAAFNNVKSMSFKEGASTISQQLIKNTHLDNSKTLKRKINEMLLAKQLEKNFDKNEILEMYLNTIYFGRNAYGIESASNVYFGKSAKDLNLQESATLAAMIKAPNIYAPDKNPDKCRARRNTVLQLMKNDGYIDEAQYSEATASLVYSCENVDVPERTYVYGVIEEACGKLNMTPLQLLNSHLTIETYYSPSVQKSLYGAAHSDCTVQEDGRTADLTSMVCDVKCGVKAYYSRGGDIRGRQIGSTAKPIAVYGPALNEKIITVASPVLDEKTDFGSYRPGNFNEKYYGWTTVKTALEKSLNIPAVKTLNSLGVEKAEKYLKNFGIEEKQNLSLALGNVNGGMNPEQLAAAYATLANGGKANTYAFISKIYNEKGTLYTRRLSEKTVFDERAAFLVTDMLRGAASKGTASALAATDVCTAAKTGTVGTEKGNSDAIIAGYTTDLVYTVWMTGSLKNEITGGTAPASVAAKFLTEVYKNKKPAEFAVPQGIIKMEIDKNQLFGNQLLLLANATADKSEKISFYFDRTNCPKNYAEKEIQKFTLSATVKNGAAEITLPTVREGVLRLWKKTADDVLELSHDGKLYVDRNVREGQPYCYFAELYVDGKLRYTCSDVKVLIPRNPDSSGENDTSEEKKKGGILDFWYLKNTADSRGKSIAD